MSGALVALLGGTPYVEVVEPEPDPDPQPVKISVTWLGASVLNVTSASGTSSGSDYFYESSSGGQSPRSVSRTFTSPDGRGGGTSGGGGWRATWSGLAVGQSTSVQMRSTVIDAAGSADTDSDSVVITRTS